jgi:hypothetical protein
MPFKNKNGQKAVSVSVLIGGIILIFSLENITAGAILSLLGLVYLLDTI